jgi:glutathione synthase/RimK-type ligase-like ATP-grasp enzyme
MTKSKHDQIAEGSAKKFGIEYKGIDVETAVTANRVIEVETTKNGMHQGIRQVKRSLKARYLAVNNRKTQNTPRVTRGT